MTDAEKVGAIRVRHDAHDNPYSGQAYLDRATLLAIHEKQREQIEAARELIDDVASPLRIEGEWHGTAVERARAWLAENQTIMESSLEGTP